MRFSEYHPLVNLIFYIIAFVFGMIYVHPAFLFCSVFASMSYYLVVKKKIWKYLLGMIGLFFIITIINPLFNVRGETILFTYLEGRAYTWEALCYGAALAAMFVSILTWFATYQEVMSSDKFIYCFGRLAPSVALSITMVLRLVPEFQKKTKQITGARKCIGKSMKDGETSEKVRHGMVIVSSLTSWALEGGVIMADSMRCRGFGTGKRTAFSTYRMKPTDLKLLIFMGILFGTILICASQGAANVQYMPNIQISGVENLWTMWGILCYGTFLCIPTMLSILEEIKWNILKSKI